MDVLEFIRTYLVQNEIDPCNVLFEIFKKILISLPKMFNINFREGGVRRKDRE